MCGGELRCLRDYSSRIYGGRQVIISHLLPLTSASFSEFSSARYWLAIYTSSTDVSFSFLPVDVVSEQGKNRRELPQERAIMLYLKIFHCLRLRDERLCLFGGCEREITCAGAGMTESKVSARRGTCTWLTYSTTLLPNNVVVSLPYPAPLV